MSTDAIRFFAATDVGNVREHNEDNFLVDKKLSLFIVADGMGGHAAGEVASAIAVRTMHEEIKRERDLLADFVGGSRGGNRVTTKDVLAVMEHAVLRACSRIHEEAETDPAKRGMGTTLSALVILGTRGFIAHVGDSRIYLARGGTVQQVTEDHTVFNELIKRGRLTKEQIEKVGHKNAITRAVGVYERVDVDTLMIEVLPGDQFLLASDGLTGYLESAEELAGYVDGDGDDGTKALIELAKDRGGKDNITVVLVRLGGEAKDDERAKHLALKREVLGRMPLFARLSDRELLRVMQSVEVREYVDEQIVIHEGDKGDELFIVLSGKVAVSRGGETLTRLGAGEHFGEMALIRAVPRSATVTANGKAELIAIRRTDFFELLRTEHEIAVKMLWQFLGVLADRLDHTSSELRHAKQELHADDVTADVTIEIFPGIEGIMRIRSAVAELALLVVAACHGNDSGKPADAGPLDVTVYNDAGPKSQPPIPHHHGDPKPFACRIIASENGPAPGADPTAWITLAEKASFSIRSSETTRELRFEGPGRVHACGIEVPLLVTGSAIALPGGGESPGAETWVATPCGVLRWAGGVHKFTATAEHGSKMDCHLRSSVGTAYLWVPAEEKIETEPLDGGGADAGAVPEAVEGWRRIDARRELRLSGAVENEKSARTSVGDCEHAMDEVDDIGARLADAGATGIGDLAAKSLVARRNARAGCAFAAARVAALAAPDAGASDAGTDLAGRVDTALARLSGRRNGR